MPNDSVPRDPHPTSSPSTGILGQLPTDAAYDISTARERASSMLTRQEAGSRYVVKNELARGGMGLIYRVFDQDLRRTSAMKVMASRIIEDERRMRAFVEEARITAQLEHPNIVPVHEIGVIDSHGCPYYIMKMVEGQQLLDIITTLASGRKDYLQYFTRHRLLDIFRKVCDAVSYAHSRGVIHRDIKPENIMVGNYGEVILMDWGLAKYLNDKQVSADEAPTRFRPSDSVANFLRTEDGMIKGSLAYLSPEQAFGDMNDIDQQTDIFLLGATLYHMLTYFPPYAADNLPELITKAEKCDYMPPSERNPRAQIPMALERIITIAMAPLKRNRYPSVQRLIEDIDAFIGGRRSSGRKIFTTGDKLTQFGDPGHDTFVIITGKVQVSRQIDGREIPIATLGAGDIVGEMAGITHSQRSATVTAMETTEALVLTHDLMLEELEKLPPWMEKIVFSLADRVRMLDRTVHPLLLSNRSFPVVNQLCYIYTQAQNEAMLQGSPSTGAPTIALPKEPVADEIAVTLGIDRQSVEDVLAIMTQFGMCPVDWEGNMRISNLADLRQFVDYCRYQFKVVGGLKQVSELQLPPGLNSFFRQMLREMRKLRAE